MFSHRGRIVARMDEDRLWASFASPIRAVRHRRTAQIRCTRHIIEMNRLTSTDSKHSLDDESRKHDHAGMIIQRYQLYIERTDTARNMARFYAMSIEPNLFGEACLTRRWGRIGTKGQMMVHHFEAEKDAVALFLDLIRQKRGRGYSTVLHGACADR